MPEFERVESSFSSDSSDSSDRSDRSDRSDQPEREGLPPGYRMRHDTHYVDQLAARAAAIPIRLLAIKDIGWPDQFAAQNLGPLVDSILKVGVLQPVLVRHRAGCYELIAGAKRMAAAVAAGLTELPCFVFHADDAHVRVLAAADNLRGAEESRHPLPHGQPAAIPSLALKELTDSLATATSCLTVSSGSSHPPYHRMAQELMQAEIQRAAWLIQGLQLLAEEPTVARRELHLDRLLDQVLATFASERRLAGVTLSVEVDSPSVTTVRADQHLVLTALAGVIRAMLALVQEAEGGAIRLALGSCASQPSTARLEISQDAVTLPSSSLSRFFDQTWVERPGGYGATIGLVAAKRIVDLHGGQIHVEPIDRGGCRVTLLIPS